MKLQYYSWPIVKQDMWEYKIWKVHLCELIITVMLYLWFSSGCNYPKYNAFINLKQLAIFPQGWKNFYWQKH